jgi:hypothetical protein
MREFDRTSLAARVAVAAIPQSGVPDRPPGSTGERGRDRTMEAAIATDASSGDGRRVRDDLPPGERRNGKERAGMLAVGRVLVAAGVVLAVLIVAGVLWLATGVRGSGNVVTETRGVGGFDRIELRGVGTVVVTQGEREVLTIAAEDNIIGHLDAAVRDGKLVLGQEERWDDVRLRPTRPIVYTVTVTALSAVALSGVGEVNVADLTAERLTIECSGAGGVTLDNIAVDHLKLVLSGSGSATISGKATVQEAQFSGNASYRAERLASERAAIDISGTARARVRVSGALDVRISGSGTVEYVGSPAINQTISGTGAIRQVKE